jgi:hypothetical protein
MELKMAIKRKVAVPQKVIPVNTKKYRVSGVGGTRDVFALDEEDARYKGMVERWGPPSGIYTRYQGLGLTVTLLPNE